MLNRGVIAATVVLAAVAAAGCFGDEPEPNYGFKASGGNAKFARGLAYDGEALVSGAGNLTIDVDALTNKGTVAGTFAATDFSSAFPITSMPGIPPSSGNFQDFMIPSEAWSFEMTSYEADPTKPFQAGGIALGFDEHGDSGVGDTSIPKVHLLAAGWGDAAIKLNGANYADPLTGKPTWKAHFMVMEKGARGADGRVKNADGSVYDPANPARGVVGEKPQAWIIMKTNPGERILKDLDENVSVTGANNPDYRGPTLEVPVALTGAAMTLTFTLGSDAPPPSPPLSDLLFVVNDPQGNEVYQTRLSNAKLSDSFATGVMAGTYTIQVTGRAIAGTYAIHEQVTYPESLTLLFEYDDVKLG